MPLELTNFFRPERRATDRFPIEQELRYRLMEVRHLAPAGEGRTVNMSSSGILFTTGAALPVGERAELSVEWPAQLNEHCGLKLVALGRIVRSDTQMAAIQIEKYDFRTRAAAAAGSPV
jgi:hypothetical protein